jgi:hypothetical protein
MRPATVRFYFDADILGLPKPLEQIRPTLCFPEAPGPSTSRPARLTT